MVPFTEAENRARRHRIGLPAAWIYAANMPGSYQPAGVRTTTFARL